MAANSAYAQMDGRVRRFLTPGLQQIETRPGGTVVYRHMRKLLLALSILVLTLWAANVKLYMTDGSYHIVREYQVQSDRVHFYSVERSQWEDIPLDLVDLKRTVGEA